MGGNTLRLAIGTALALGLSSTSMAVTISWEDFTAGQHTNDLGYAEAKAWKNFFPDGPGDVPGDEESDIGLFGTKSDNGLSGVGVQGGPAGNEIDYGPEEAITIDFLGGSNPLGPTRIGGIELGLLFDGPEFNDGQEIAVILAEFEGDVVDGGLLTATGETTATWSALGGSAYNCGPATPGGPGCFGVTNPFGDAQVDRLSFWAGDNRDGGSGNNSDYVIGNVTTVPTPGSLALLGIGLVGIGAARRRQRRA